MMLKEIFNPQNYYWNQHALPVLLSGIVILFLGIFVCLKRMKLINISFLFWSISVSFWLFGNSLAYMAKYDWIVIEQYNRFEFLGVCFISVLGYLVSISWDKELFEKQKKYVIIAGLISTIFYLSNLKFNYILTGVYHYFWGRYFKNGVGGTIFIIYWLIPFFLTLMNYITLYKRSEGKSKKQYKLILSATFIAYFGALDWLPCYGFEIYPIGYIAILIFFFLIAYAIIRYQAFEIDTVIHRSALWLATSLWLIIPAYFLFKFTRYWLQSLSTLWLTISALGLFYLFLWYYRYFQPKIDHLFRRRKYDYQAILDRISERIATTINIEELTSKLLTEVCKTMYLRNSLFYISVKGQEKFSLIGRRGYKEINGIKQLESLEIFTEEESSGRLNDCQELSYNNSFYQLLMTQQDVLTREQIEINPQHEKIRQEASRWFTEQNVELVVPLILEDKVNGLLCLGKKDTLQAYTLKDIQLLKKLGREVGVTVYNSLHYRDLLEKDRLEEEMKLGRDIQTTLLPKESPQIANLSISGLMLPAKEIGGDYYDFIKLPQEGHLGIAIGDVSGKGVAAGLIMATAKATLKGLSQQNLTPKQILTQTNNILYEYTNGQKFMTMLYFQYRAKDRVLNYSSAGHEHILIYRASKNEIETIMGGGFMLGILLNIESYLEEHKIILEPKDKVLLYTDGVTEAENPLGERFGLDRLIQSLKTNSSKAPLELIQDIKNGVYSFMQTQPQYDDITLVGMEAG